jgi:hypothetical protein
LVHYIKMALPDGFLSPDSESELIDAVAAFKALDARRPHTECGNQK